MRSLLLADVHSNFVALKAVLDDAKAERFDQIIFAGDLVDYGLNPEPCIEWCFKSKAIAVRGNHDHAVAQRIPARGATGFRALAAATRPAHWQLISPKCLKFLGRLPVTLFHRRPEASFFVIHGTPRDPLDEYLTADAVAWEQRLEGISADFVIVGHTHVQFDITAGSTRVINPGSVGQPRDGTAGAAYAVLDGEHVDFRRADYDIGAAVDDVRAAGAEDWVIELTDALLRAGGNLTRNEMDAISQKTPEV